MEDQIEIVNFLNQEDHKRKLKIKKELNYTLPIVNLFF